MADEPGIVESTVTEAKAHPWLIGGFLVAAVLVIYLISRKSKGTSFTYSSGPSEAQINANTALAVNQQKDQTALGLAQIAATSNATTAQSNAGIAQNYFSYLTTASANGLAADQIASNTAIGVAGIQGYTTQRANDDSLQAVANTNQANVNMAGIAASRDVQIANSHDNSTNYVATQGTYQHILDVQQSEGLEAMGFIPAGFTNKAS